MLLSNHPAHELLVVLCGMILFWAIVSWFFAAKKLKGKDFEAVGLQFEWLGPYFSFLVLVPKNEDAKQTLTAVRIRFACVLLAYFAIALLAKK